MAFWDSKNGKIVRAEPEPYPGYDGWLLVDCGCSNGLEWGGDWPRECDRCGGSGHIAKHKESGRFALYPGGPFRG